MEPKLFHKNILKEGIEGNVFKSMKREKGEILPDGKTDTVRASQKSKTPYMTCRDAPRNYAARYIQSIGIRSPSIVLSTKHQGGVLDHWTCEPCLYDSFKSGNASWFLGLENIGKAESE